MSQLQLLVEHSGPLAGKVTVGGAKNAALKILAGSLLTKKPTTISNLPHLHDITFMLQLLSGLGSNITLTDQTTVSINNSNLKNTVVPYELVKKMRASIVVLGPLLAAYGQADVALPGGCMIGTRPVDIHIEGLRKMGASIEVENGFIKARLAAKTRLTGCDINMHTVTVTGTENLLMAATLAYGTTNLYNAACEPEVVDLANFLNTLGANIKGAGTPHITIVGTDSLSGGHHHVIGDRIEAGTYLVAAAMTRGSVTVDGIKPGIIANTIDVLRQAGADITCASDSVTLNMHNATPKAVSITTAPYPGFATDMQAQILAMNAIAQGKSQVRENIFENRFLHVCELQRMGADIEVNGDTVIINGPCTLKGVPVMARDLRAAASLVLAGLVASGTTTIEGVHHLDRGYEYLEEKFAKLGAKLERKQAN